MINERCKVLKFCLNWQKI